MNNTKDRRKGNIETEKPAVKTNTTDNYDHKWKKAFEKTLYIPL